MEEHTCKSAFYIYLHVFVFFLNRVLPIKILKFTSVSIPARSQLQQFHIPSLSLRFLRVFGDRLFPGAQPGMNLCSASVPVHWSEKRETALASDQTNSALWCMVFIPPPPLDHTHTHTPSISHITNAPPSFPSLTLHSSGKTFSRARGTKRDQRLCRLFKPLSAGLKMGVSSLFNLLFTRNHPFSLCLSG